MLAQPGAGQTKEKRDEWLRRIMNEPGVDKEIRSIAKTELGIE